MHAQANQGGMANSNDVDLGMNLNGKGWSSLPGHQSAPTGGGLDAQYGSFGDKQQEQIDAIRNGELSFLSLQGVYQTKSQPKFGSSSKGPSREYLQSMSMSDAIAMVKGDPEKKAANKGGGDRNLSDPKQYPGISIYQNNDKSDMTAVTLPGFGIYVGGGYSGRSLTRVMQHEYGHYLDYKFSPNLNYNGMGLTNFYLGIGVPSLFNAATGIGGSHSSYWTEIRANQWSEIWFGKNLDPDFLKLYPTK